MGDKDSIGFARIVRALAIDKDCLDIHFSNGSAILLQTDLILGLPGFEALREDNRVLYPKTDGSSIYWRDGPRPLFVEEVLALVGKSPKV